MNKMQIDEWVVLPSSVCIVANNKRASTSRRLTQQRWQNLCKKYPSKWTYSCKSVKGFPCSEIYCIYRVHRNRDHCQLTITISQFPAKKVKRSQLQVNSSQTTPYTYFFSQYIPKGEEHTKSQTSFSRIFNGFHSCRIQFHPHAIPALEYSFCAYD